jgi:outer membrane receptor protein involved in Fe transport
MLSNFTFFLDDPIHGDEVQQTETLFTYGGRVERTFRPAKTLSVTTGVEGRYDDISQVGLFHTENGMRIGERGQFAVDEGSAAAYVEATWRPVERLALFGGLRADGYSFKVRPLTASAWAGKEKDSLLSPKVGANFEVADGIALYANWGRGFHSNDARGVTAPVDPAPGLVVGEGKELGARFEHGGLILSADYWWMDVDSELIYVGDAGSVEPSAASRRRGYEVTAFWRPRSWLALDGVWTASHARFKDSPGAEYVPGALESAGELGASAIFPAWNAAVRVRHMGRHPMTEDNSIRSEPTTVVNLRAAWTPGRVEVFGELLNALNSRKKDIEYYYTSYLPAIDTDGPVDDIHSRPVEPRMVRAGVRVTF